MARSAALAVAARRDRLAGERGCRATLGLLPLTCVLRAVHHRASLSFYPTLLRLVGDGSSGGGSGGVGRAEVPASTRPSTQPFFT